MLLANGSTPAPGGTTFVFFNGSPALDEGNVAFRAEFRALDSSRQQGIFTTVGGPLTAVADTRTAVPGSTGNFTFFGEPALDGDTVAFTGFGAGDHVGIYIATAGSLMKVIDTNDLLDGKQVSSFALGRNGLEGDSLTFLARFADGSEGIFLAETGAQPGVIEIDIKPGGFPNSLNPRSKGVIPVAILTTRAFDATTVDSLSLEFGPNGAREAHGRGHIQDVDGDGDLDLVLHFRTQDTGIRCGDASASLRGETLAGDPIQGSDSIRTVGCK